MGKGILGKGVSFQTLATQAKMASFIRGWFHDLGLERKTNPLASSRKNNRKLNRRLQVFMLKRSFVAV